MRTIETIVRTLNEWEEFDPKVHQKILEKLQRDTYFDSVFRIAEFIGELESVGFSDVDIYYDISYSQGEGACFTGKWTMPKESPKYGEEAIKLYQSIIQILQDCRADNECVSFEIGKNTHHYCHEYTVSVYNAEIFQDYEKPQYDIEKQMENVCRQYMRYTFSVLKNDYEYQMSEENLLEQYSDFEFFGDGTMV